MYKDGCMEPTSPSAIDAKAWPAPASLSSDPKGRPIYVRREGSRLSPYLLTASFSQKPPSKFCFFPCIGCPTDTICPSLPTLKPRATWAHGIYLP
ncbi:hypothetical protein LX36DRAFT_122060 [Colletotrichum falcatum]|nr:hypothetical protein LX36DRAFT_122060 [Colletotrichum falcatum]